MQISGDDLILPSVSVYFHIPFCTKKCPFCSFYVLPDRPRDHEPFLQALLCEWKMRLPQFQGKEICSFYFGGGTPTKLPISALARIFEEIAQSSLTISSQCEITLEANPEDLSLSKLREYKRLGINRLSIGVQSFADEELISLGRTHDAGMALRALDLAHMAEFDNVSLDLMIELPRQTKESLRRSLDHLQKVKMTHLSLYNLVLEPHTLFGKRKREIESLLPSDQEKLALFEETLAFIETLGLQRYEISAFARPGYAAVHNMGYWTGRPFLGFGPSAFSYWETCRFSNVAHLSRYISSLRNGKLPVVFEESLSLEKRQRELFVIQLRLLEGVSQEDFEARHGPLPTLFIQELIEQQKKGMLDFHKEPRHWFLTNAGLLHFDTLAVVLI